ncbi:MAG: hypothetical protein TR69_WS6001000929 [candidate division WS6 bacterium OLB20]|uniref:Peptidase family M23 n=1 Tax=candidate division WS6 bacterium OLB20 TaxID=1617426 RepID=A0A136LZ61_9BACT|nr:MAG: hypothetical protein TR69_WS6001000929 [candidate division WS6 bacterium OLB20]
MKKMLVAVILFVLTGGLYIHAVIAEQYPVIIENTDDYADAISPALERMLKTEIAHNWTKERHPQNLFVIGDVRIEDGWGIVSLFPKALETESMLAAQHYSSFQSENGMNALFLEDPLLVALEGNTSAGMIIRSLPAEEQSSLTTYFTPEYSSAGDLSQVYLGYKFPFDRSVGFNIWRHPHGWHNDASGNKALDFGGGDITTDTYVLSAAPGMVTSICKNTDGRQAFMYIQTEDPDNPGTLLKGETLLYLHFDKDSIPAEIKQNAWVERGQILGRLVEGGDELNSSCPQYGVGRHSHITFPNKPFVIDSHTMTTYDDGSLKILKDSQELHWTKDTVFNSTQDTEGACDLVDGMIWHVYKDCFLSGHNVVNSHVWIGSGSMLTLEPYSTLDIDFSSSYLKVSPEGGITLKSQSKLY